MATGGSQQEMLAAGYNSGDPVRRAAALTGGYVPPKTTDTGTTKTGATGTTVTKSSNTDAFLSALQSKLLAQGNIVSSGSTKLEESIKAAIGSTEKATAAGSKAIGLAADREIGAQKAEFASSRNSFLESQRGFATNAAALSQLDTRTEKSLRDLEQRKQELMLQNDAAGASKIADMQFKAIEFRQQAEQQAFSNLLNMGQFAMSMRADERATQQFQDTMDFNKKQFQFTMDSKISDIATEFGVEVLPGDTLESISNRVRPLASQKRKLEIDALVKASASESEKISSTGYLMDALLGQGAFVKEDGSSNPQPPASAALSVANYLRQLGVKVTPKMLDEMTAEANRINETRQVIKDEVVAEETGKNFWNTGTSLFGSSFTSGLPNFSAPPAPQDGQSKLNVGGGAYGVLTPQTAAFQSLFTL